MSKVMMVTGGSRGIGAATARLAARRDYAVCVCFRTGSQEAAAVVSDIEREGGRAVAVRVDVSDQEQVIELFETCDRTLGSVSVLVNNAGVLETQSRVEQIDAGRLRRVFETNVYGSFFCGREAVRRMSTRHGGRGGAIVNVSSVAARLGASGEYVDYAASKGAIDSFTVGLAGEVAGEGIRVNGVRPGFIYTDIHASGGEPGRVDRIAHTLPLKRGGTAEEVANAIVWLASEEASFVTGAILDVAGGR